MTNVGALEGLTSAIGDELNELAGFRITRLTDPFLADERIDQGTANSGGSGVTITLSSGTFNGNVALGHIFRITSGLLYGAEGTIVGLPSSISVTLDASMGTFSGESWEVIDRQTEMFVETTLGWPATGYLYLDSVLYRYTAKTLSSFQDIAYRDGTNTFIAGAAKDHRPLAEVLDFTRNYSALDGIRRSFLVNYATGYDLNVIGANLGLPRPSFIDNDDIYREFIKAVAYAPRGTIYSIELALNALLGPGNWELFEDLTLGSINHGCTVFLRRTNDWETNPEGKAYIEGPEIRQITSATALTTVNDPITVQNVLLAPDPVHVIDSGTGATSTDGGVTVTGTFSTTIRGGDLFIITNGPLLGRSARIWGAASFLLSLNDSIPQPGTPFSKIGSNFENVSWKVIRDRTDTRFYKPSGDVRREYSGDSGTTQWTYIGSGSETLRATLITDTTYGSYLKLQDTLPLETVAYRHTARIVPESNASFELHMDLGFGFSLGTTATDGLQICMQLADGERRIGVGFIGDVGATFARFGFIDTATGSFIGSPSSKPQYIYASWPNPKTLRIEKHGRNRIRLYVDNRVVDTVDYASCASATSHELVFGLLSATVSGPVINVKHVNWSIDTVKDYWNLHATDGILINPNRLQSASGFVIDDVGRHVQIHEHGHNRGNWLCDSYVSAGEITLIGPIKSGARMSILAPTRIIVEGEQDAFEWPTDIGHQIEVLSGPNTGTYTITKILDGDSLQDLSHRYDVNGNDLGPYDSITVSGLYQNEAQRPKFKGDAVEVTGASFVLDENADWRLIPQFIGDTGVEFEIAGTGSVSGNNLLLRQNFPIVPSVVSVEYSTVLTAQTRDEADNNVFTAGNYRFHAFYLADNWSWLADVIDNLTAAGVKADFHSLVRDESGIHIIE